MTEEKIKETSVRKESSKRPDVIVLFDYKNSESKLVENEKQTPRLKDKKEGRLSRFAVGFYECMNIAINTLYMQIKKIDYFTPSEDAKKNLEKVCIDIRSRNFFEREDKKRTLE